MGSSGPRSQAASGPSRTRSHSKTIGYRGEGRIDASSWDSWLELHIEQSDRLEDANTPVGVVTSITGTTRCLVEVAGEANHAGSTAMCDRQDALAAASEVVLELEAATNDVVAEKGDTVVGTVGKLDVAPNAVNVVPGRVELGIDVRDIDYGSMERIVEHIQGYFSDLEDERGVVTTFERPYDIEPVDMADRCTAAIRDAAARSGVDSLGMHSGADHDTMHIAKVTDAGMLFAPSRDGASHSPLEWTDWSDCAAATAVLGRVLAALAAK